MDRSSEKEVLGDELSGRLSALLPGDFHLLDCRHVDQVRSIACESFPKVWSEKDFAYFLAHENRFCLGIGSETDAGTRLRVYLLALLVQGDLDIVSVATRAEDRRLGLAQRLMEAVCTDSRVQRSFLEVEVDNEPAIELYRKLGFETLGRRSAYYGPNRDALLMRWVRPSNLADPTL